LYRDGVKKEKKKNFTTVWKSELKLELKSELKLELKSELK